MYRYSRHACTYVLLCIYSTFRDFFSLEINSNHEIPTCLYVLLKTIKHTVKNKLQDNYDETMGIKTQRRSTSFIEEIISVDHAIPFKDWKRIKKII